MKQQTYLHQILREIIHFGGVALVLLLLLFVRKPWGILDAADRISVTAPIPQGSHRYLQSYYPWLTVDLYGQMRLKGQEYGVPVELVVSLVEQESSGRAGVDGPTVCIPNAKGVVFCTRAIGLMQVLASNYEGPTRELYDPATNINWGVRYLGYCLRLANGNVVTALKNYNSGPSSNYYDMDYISKIVARYEKTTIRSRSPRMR